MQDVDDVAPILPDHVFASHRSQSETRPLLKLNLPASHSLQPPAPTNFLYLPSPHA